MSPLMTTRVMIVGVWELGWCSWVWAREHEILSQVLTGLALAWDVLPEEVSGPHTFEMINLIYFLTLHNCALSSVHN
jgi:hypothetical protein